MNCVLHLIAKNLRVLRKHKRIPPEYLEYKNAPHLRKKRNAALTDYMVVIPIRKKESKLIEIYGL